MKLLGGVPTQFVLVSSAFSRVHLRLKFQLSFSETMSAKVMPIDFVF